jgi:HEAT repeat protein
MSARGIALLSCVVVLLSAAGWRSSADAEPLSGQQISVTDGRVSVQLSNAPLAGVLREIGRQAGLSIVILRQADLAVTIAFRDLSLDEAVRALSRGTAGGVLVYEESTPGPQRLVGAFLTLEAGGPGIRDARPVAAPSPAASVAPSGQVAGAASIGGPPGPAAMAKAEEQLRTGMIEDFLPAARVLYPDKLGVDAVYAAATEHPNPNVRTNALAVLAEVGRGPKAIQVLEQAAQDMDPTVRSLAKQMLGLTKPRR